ncbi:MAG: serine/threonine-protein kinase [Myxococcota bacterium]
MSSVAPRPAHTGLAAKAAGGKLVFGKYRIHGRIGRGGMGEVYLASLMGELGFEKRLVIKTILPEHAAKPKFVEMFAAEAKTAVSLSHGNIVPIYELGKADDTLYIVMGHVDGPSVDRMIAAYRKRGDPPPVGLALLLVREVLSGLAYAHTAGVRRPAVVHRDISPRNVLVDRSGQVRIVDFGIAVPANVESVVRGGSTGYMAPEQARAELADPRADVFSAACLLYELLTLDKAFPKKGVWVAPNMDALPAELSGVLREALSLDPLDRPADAGAFVEALGPALAKFAVTLTDTALAAHLRELFPDGWEQAEEKADPDQLTPVTNVEPKTYATRLTEITGGNTPIKRAAAAATPAPKPEPAPARARWKPALALLALGGVTAALITTLPRSDDPEEGSAPPRTGQRQVTAAEGPEADGKADGGAPTKDDSIAAASAGAIAGGDDAETTAPPEAKAAWLTLDLQPADARITVGGVPLTGTAPYRIPVPEQGEASVRVHRPGYEPQTFAVAAGDADARRTIRLQRERPKAKGFLQVFSTSVSWAEVTVDGKRRGTTPTRKLELPEGAHRVVVRCVPDVCPTPRVLLEKTVTLKAGETTRVTER